MSQYLSKCHIVGITCRGSNAFDMFYFVVTVADNVQNMKPVQKCAGVICLTFSTIVHI